MKPKTTLEWSEAFLREYLSHTGTPAEEMEQINNLIKIHAAHLQGSAEQRLTLLENKVRAMESDASLLKMRGGK